MRSRSASCRARASSTTASKSRTPQRASRLRKSASNAALLSAVLESLRKLAQAVRNRRDASALAGMDERMLRDIGLTRSDLRDAYAELLWSGRPALPVRRDGAIIGQVTLNALSRLAARPQ